MTHRIAKIENDPVHMRRDITPRPVLAALADAKVFARARVLDSGYAIGWPRTEIAFAADGLWYDAHPRDLPSPDAVMSAAEFKSWLKSEGLSLAFAASRVFGSCSSFLRPLVPEPSHRLSRRRCLGSRARRVPGASPELTQACGAAPQAPTTAQRDGLQVWSPSGIGAVPASRTRSVPPAPASALC